MIARFARRWASVDFRRWGCATLIALHVAKVAFWMRNIDFRSGLPIVNVDFLQYYARALRAHEFWSTSERYWGFDPFEMAGYPAGLYNEVGTYFTSLACHLLARWIPIATSLLTMEI